MMNKIEELRDLIEICFESGYLRGQRDLNPSTDKIRKKDAEAILMRNGMQKVLLSRWVEAGMITEHKGENNSPIWYSLSQIMATITAIRTNNFIVTL